MDGYVIGLAVGLGAGIAIGISIGRKQKRLYFKSMGQPVRLILFLLLKEFNYPLKTYA
ncbi:hypothetical protein ACFLUZ_05655 [Chloroflexota bacterium]